MKPSANRPTLPFADDSAVRCIHRESILLLGGGRALLMQLANPGVALGVAEHSSFQQGPLQRLLRTLKPMFAIVFGSSEQAEAAAATINRTHGRVRGEDYDAQDPELLLWVWATLVDTALATHARFVGPLARRIADSYYSDMQHVGLLLGVPSELQPRGLSEFEGFVAGQIAALRVSDEARRIASRVFRPWPPHWAIMWPMKHLTAGLLPGPLREQYGLAWGPRRERALVFASGLVRRGLPLVPGPLRQPPRFLLPPRLS